MATFDPTKGQFVSAEQRQSFKQQQEQQAQQQGFQFQQQAEQPEQKGIFSRLAGAVAKPIFRTGLTAVRLGQSVSRLARGDVAGAGEILEKGAAVPFSGEFVKPVGQTEGTLAGIKDILGTGLDLGTTVIAPGAGTAVKGVAKVGAKEATKQILRQGTKLGVVSGAATGAGVALQEGEDIGGVVRETLIGGAFGGVLGALTSKVQARKFAKAPEKAEKVQERAADFYRKGFAATKEKQKENVEKLLPVLMDKKWWGTRKSLLKKAEQGIELGNKQYEELGELQGMVQVGGLVDKMDERLATFLRPDGTVKSFKKTEHRALTEAKNDLLSYAAYSESKNKPEAYKQTLRELSQQMGNALYDTRKAVRTVKDSKTLSQLKFVDDSIRKILAESTPEYAQINKFYSANQRLKDVVEETLSRKAPQNWLSLTNAVTAGTGAIFGLASGNITGAVVLGATMAGLSKIAHSSWFNTMIAARKARVAEKLLQQTPEQMVSSITRIANFGIKAINEMLEGGAPEGEEQEQEIPQAEAEEATEQQPPVEIEEPPQQTARFGQ